MMVVYFTEFLDSVFPTRSSHVYAVMDMHIMHVPQANAEKLKFNGDWVDLHAKDQFGKVLELIIFAVRVTAFGDMRVLPFKQIIRPVHGQFV